MVKQAESVKQPDFLRFFARNWLDSLGSASGAFRVEKSKFNSPLRGSGGDAWDIVLKLNCRGRRKPLTLLVICRKQMTPRIALGLLDAQRPAPSGAAILVFSPSISPRVAEICRQRGIGYLDAAGNCLLSADGLYIERSGRENTQPDTRPLRRLFSEKSSRVSRALLTEPRKGWHVQELAATAHVSLGLASKVKHALITEGYVVERERKLFLRDARELLDAWAAEYRPKVEPLKLFVPGTGSKSETAVAAWLETHSLRFGLTQYSGAWRTAPMVRLSRVTIWVDLLPPAAWTDFKRMTGGSQVDSGENVLLWQTDDPAVFDGLRTLGDPPLPTVSPIQLYLDLKSLVGRGEEAAEAIYEQELAPEFVSIGLQTSVGSSAGAK